MSIEFESPEVQLQTLRERLRKMTDAELVQFGKQVRQLSGPRVSAIPDPWQVQLAEARAEWRRTHPQAGSYLPLVVCWFTNPQAVMGNVSLQKTRSVHSIPQTLPLISALNLPE